MTKDLILENWALDRLHGEQLPEAAIMLLEDGFDSPSLRELAGQQRPVLRDAAPLFRDRLTEIGLVVPPPEVAAMRLGMYYAGEIVSGRIEAFAGAREIWQIDCHTRMTAFSAFVWPDTADEIVEAARHLLSLPAV